MIVNKMTKVNKKISRAVYIRGLLMLIGSTPNTIADELKVTRSCVSHVIAGRTKSKRVQQYIADKLNMAFSELWGEPKKKAA